MGASVKNPVRYVINSKGPNPEAAREAIRKAIALAEEHGVSITFLGSAKENLRRFLTENLGQAVAAQLSQTGAVYRSEGFELRGETVRTLSSSFVEPTVLVAVHPSEKMLRLVDDLQGPVAIVALPWMDGPVRSWCRTWSPELIGEDGPLDGTACSTPACPQAAALVERLVGFINVSTGLTHPCDHDHAIDLLEEAHASEGIPAPRELEAAALRAGLDTKASKKLKDMATKIAAGRRVRRS